MCCLRQLENIKLFVLLLQLIPVEVSEKNCKDRTLENQNSGARFTITLLLIFRSLLLFSPFYISHRMIVSTKRVSIVRFVDCGMAVDEKDLFCFIKWDGSLLESASIRY